MGAYHCWGCNKLKNDDYSPMGKHSLCDECEGILEGWTITHNPKPIPTRSMDWDFISDEYDGENGLCGTAPSLVNAIEQIMEIEYE